jgi:CubicO group peptidase (beta-lactamase class C family)
LCCCAASDASIGDIKALESTLQKIVSAEADFFNISLSVAFDLGSRGGVVAAAAGYDDHKTGTLTTTSTMYPSGSVAKTYLVVAMMRQQELKKLDLDTPIHQYIDSWNAKQTPPQPSLLEMWGGNKVINTVTSRQLLQMRGGMQEYNDFELFNWTLNNADQDYQPIEYITSLNKTFLFPPGEGGKYSSTGYVLGGMVLASVTGAATWDKLDLRALVNGGAAAKDYVGKDTVFMGAGHCTQYPGVAHQYVYGKRPYGASRPIAPAAAAQLAAAARGGAARAAAGGRGGECSYAPNYPGVVPLGQRLGPAFSADSAAACCGKVTALHGAQLFTWWQNGTCVGWSEAYSGTNSPEASSGKVDVPTVLADFTDLADFSCLNGWTMGNIAVAPKDLVRFYSALAGGELVNTDSFQQMTAWLPLTMGRSPGVGTMYGLGLIESSQPQFKLNVTDGSNCKPPLCVCKTPKRPPGTKVCYLNVSSGWGHPGLDWGSGMPNAGYFEFEGLSPVALTLGFNAFRGMNTSMGSIGNGATGFGYTGALCRAFSAVMQFKVPGFPDFVCKPW